MRETAERAASLALRDGGPAPVRHATDWYHTHDRLHTGDLIAMAPADAFANPAAYVFDARGEQHVFYRARVNNVEGHIWELYWESFTGSWHARDLTADTGGKVIASPGNPAGYVFDARDEQHVVYRAGDGSIRELYCDAAGWHPGDLTPTGPHHPGGCRWRARDGWTTCGAY